jgi:MSHA pilin protein MshA
MQKQKGFSLIELVVVIVILGVLSAVAIPRFVGMSADAKIASLKTIESSLQSAARLVYYKAVIYGNERDAENNEIVIDDRNVLIKYGYPVAISESSSDILDMIELAGPIQSCGGSGKTCNSGDQTQLVIGFLDEKQDGSLTQCYVRYIEPGGNGNQSKSRYYTEVVDTEC